MMSNCVSFYLNGQKTTIENPSPDLLLIDYLRSPSVGLIGVKKGCGQGGCGACTVILSKWDSKNATVEHRSINSCLRPVCALGGLAVTTIEGTGGIPKTDHVHLTHMPSVSRSITTELSAPSRRWNDTKTKLKEAHEVKLSRSRLSHNKLKKTDSPMVNLAVDGSNVNGMNPVAHRLAVNNGSQCGYCSVGFVMNMSAFLAEHPEPTKQEIEEVFDGNICRCTGYRSILTGMKTFASDWSEKDEAIRMKCVTEDRCDEVMIHDAINIPFPEETKNLSKKVEADSDTQKWVTPEGLEELLELLRNNPSESTRLVFGNTSFGIYADEYPSVKLFVDIKLINELYGISESDEAIHLGASTTYSELLEYLRSQDKLNPTSRLGALEFMTHRTAGMIVRNVASLAGNTMLVLKHVHEGEPFPSDLLTVLTAVGVQIKYVTVSSGKTIVSSIDQLIQSVKSDQKVANDILLLSYLVPLGNNNEVALAQKVALREVNSHSIVNFCSRIEIEDSRVKVASLVYGGIGPVPWRAKKCEQLLAGKALDLKLLQKLSKTLKIEVREEFAYWNKQKRYKGLISEGFTEEYKMTLTNSFLYKAIIRTLEATDPMIVPKELRSAGQINWGNWGISAGIQEYENQDFKAPVSQPYIKLMTFHQTMGQVHYTHELELPVLGKNASFVQSKRSLACYHFKSSETGESISKLELNNYLKTRYGSFCALITYEDIPPGGMNYQGMGSDQPILAVDEILYQGQAIALVIAETEQDAIEISEYVSDHNIGYTEISWPGAWKKPILSIDRAIEMGSIFPDSPESASFVSHIWKITRPASEFYWTDQELDPLDKDPKESQVQVDGNTCNVITNTQISGEQIHFYMETQSCVAIPEDDEQMTVYPSSQSPMEMHVTAAASLGYELNKINVSTRQLGGGYGGKTEQAKFVLGPVAVASRKLNIPIRLVMKREHDTAMIGKRHGYYGQYQIAIDQGKIRKEDKGIIRGLLLKIWADGGAFYDCSYIVSNCVQLRIDNAYRIKNFESQLDVCRTNKAPNTAMRAFGDIQGKLILENAIDDAAYSVDMDPADVRWKNMYERGDVTPFGQALSYCYMRDVWTYVREKSDYDNRKNKIAEFNKNNKWKKRGIYMIPVKYGSGYNLVQIEQAAAIVSIYSNDGTITINQGGVDMGQGLITIVEQIASYVLNVPMNMIKVHHPETKVIPNPTSSGGSTGTTYNAEAVKQACEKMRARLMEFGQKLLKENGDEWCKTNGVDYWNYGVKGWSTEITKPVDQHPKLIWQNLIALAYQYRIDLISAFTAPIAGGTTPIPAMTFKSPSEQKAIPGIELADVASTAGAVDSFVGFTFSAACSEVELDVLTGEVKVLKSDIVYDMGWSINPAIDIGQVEGAFVQGLGYVMTEKLVFEPEGEEKGRLNTLNTWRYKPPAVTTIPLEMNTYLYPRSNSSEVPDNPNELFSSKEVGEPPLVLATSVFFAIKDAIRSSRIERGLNPYFKLNAPATVQEVSRACELSDPDQLII
ncbi:MAG: molybdopterin-dependent oxidoreductase [Cyclobacteriaceae bacterium]